jgi:hypothetical protein
MLKELIWPGLAWIGRMLMKQWAYVGAGAQAAGLKSSSGLDWPGLAWIGLDWPGLGTLTDAVGSWSGRKK